MTVIYGVDSEGTVTPIMVRDAIIRCFREAHREAIEQMSRNSSFPSEEARKSFEDMQIDMIVRNAFSNESVDFDMPTKEGIIRVMDYLAKFSSKFRSPEIIKKHYDQIMVLVNKL